MGFHGVSPWSLLLILIIIVLLFGTKRLKEIGKDLGEMTKSFKRGLSETTELKEEINSSLQQDATQQKSAADKF